MTADRGERDPARAVADARPLAVRVPGDKSISQRALILGAMAAGDSRIAGLPRGADPLATASALAGLGVEISGLDGPDDAPVTVRGRGIGGWRQPAADLDLRNSGTGARLLAGALAAQPLSAVLRGDASLSRRPMERIAGPLRRMGAAVDWIERPGVLPMRVAGGELRGIRHDGRVASAQVKSAVLLAGAGAGVAVEVREPRRSRDHTERMLRAMGAVVDEGWRDGAWSVRLRRPAGQLRGRRTDPPSVPVRLRPLDIDVPGDYSSAAFLMAWAALARPAERGGELVIRGVGLNPTRTGFHAVLRRMGARVEVEAAGTTAGEPVGDLRCLPPAGRLRAVEVGGDEIPGMIDEVPVLAVLAARARGVTRIVGARELRVKESDRLAALATNLGRIGVRVRELPDGLEIEGTGRRLAGRAECFHDHRIAMAFGVLGAAPGCSVTVDDPDVADVSFPGFWELLDQVSRGRREPTRPDAGQWHRGGGGGGPGRRPDRPGGRTATDGFSAAFRLSASPPPDRPSGREAPDASCAIVAIDGSAGAGKSTTAAAVAKRLGLRHLDSGALYRAVAHALMRSGGHPDEWDRLTLDKLTMLRLGVRWRGTRMAVTLGGRPVPDSELRGPKVSAAASRAAAIPVVRKHLLDLQRRAAAPPGVVAEGRDMATVVFPEAQLKVFLDADVHVRARRRVLQRGEAPDSERVEAEAGRIATRDRRDRSRAAAPLVLAPGAVVLDTTHLDPAEQVEAVVQRALPFVASSL